MRRQYEEILMVVQLKMTRISYSPLSAIKAELYMVLRSEGPNSPLYGIDKQVLKSFLQYPTVLRNASDQLLHSDIVIYFSFRFIKDKVNQSIKTYVNSLISPDAPTTRYNGEDSSDGTVRRRRGCCKKVKYYRHNYSESYGDSTDSGGESMSRAERKPKYFKCMTFVLQMVKSTIREALDYRIYRLENA